MTEPIEAPIEEPLTEEELLKLELDIEVWETELADLDPEDRSEVREVLSTQILNAKLTIRQTRYAQADSVRGWVPSGDLKPFLDREAKSQEPEVLTRSDDQPLFYRGKLNLLFGDSNGGKTWIALAATAQELMAGRKVLWLDAEEPNPLGTVTRLRSMTVNGATVTDEQILAGLLVANPSDALGVEEVKELSLMIIEEDIGLVVLDSLGEALNLAGLDPDRDADVGKFMPRLKHLVAAGAGVIAIDHETKASASSSKVTDASFYPSGSMRKRATIDGAAFLVRSATPFSKDTSGASVLKTAKDRLGTFARKSDAAVARFDTTSEPGTVHITIEEPESAKAADDEAKKRESAIGRYEAIIDFVHENPGCSKKAVREAIGVAHQTTADAIAWLTSADLLADDGVGKSAALRLTTSPDLAKQKARGQGITISPNGVSAASAN